MTRITFAPTWLSGDTPRLSLFDIMNSNAKNRFVNIIDILSFNRDIRQLVDIINTDLEAPDSRCFRPVSHPAGFSGLIAGRRLTIADAYIRLLAHSRSKGYVERIEALQTMMHYIRYSEKVSMPVNTARVQIALMRNAVKMRGNIQAQLEMMSDFSLAAAGKGGVIRRLLKELNLIEVSESAGDISDQMLAWDDHVHEAMTEEYHSPTQLVLNAFIKGMSKITISSYNISERQKIEETYLASQILGIHSQIAIRFTVGRATRRRNYLYIPSIDWDDKKFWNFWDEHRDKLKPFLDGIDVNSKKRAEMIQELIRGFNEKIVPEYNKPFESYDALKLAPISWDDVQDVTRKGQINRKHLGYVLFRAIEPVALKRTLYLKNKYKMEKDGSEHAHKYYEQYLEEKRKYEALTPSQCVDLYISPELDSDYDSCFEHESDILPLLAECGGYVAYIRVLRHGIEEAVETVIKNYRWLTDVEVYNMVDAERFGQEMYCEFSEFIQALHRGDCESVKLILERHRITAGDDDIRACCEYVSAHPFYTRCASDSLGWSSKIPGMGFFQEFQLDSRAFKPIRENGHAPLPQPVADLLCAHRPKESDKRQVFMLSAMEKRGEWIDGEVLPQKMTLGRFWRYMNVDVRCFIKICIGFIPTYLCLGPGFAILWFILTGFRNAIVDLISSAGVGPKNWKIHSIDRENLCTSLFFTGFSVPIMSAAKLGFDYLWCDTLILETGFLYTFIKFWIIALANGLYLASHNTLRGFDKSAVRGNFFRSVLSWPLATAASYILTPLGVPDVVQAKLASEVVAGIIEGTVKYRKQQRLARKALYEVYKQLLAENPVNALMAKLDILYFWSHFGFGRKALEMFWTTHGEKVLSESQQELVRAGNLCIDRAFHDTETPERITYSVLEYYPKENLEVLTDLLGDSYRPFVKWLDDRKKLE